MRNRSDGSGGENLERKIALKFPIGLIRLAKYSKSPRLASPRSRCNISGTDYRRFGEVSVRLVQLLIGEWEPISPRQSQTR